MWKDLSIRKEGKTIRIRESTLKCLKDGKFTFNKNETYDDKINKLLDLWDYKIKELKKRWKNLSKKQVIFLSLLILEIFLIISFLNIFSIYTYINPEPDLEENKIRILIKE